MKRKILLSAFLVGTLSVSARVLGTISSDTLSLNPRFGITPGFGGGKPHKPIPSRPFHPLVVHEGYTLYYICSRAGSLNGVTIEAHNGSNISLLNGGTINGADFSDFIVPLGATLKVTDGEIK
ncbi:MAG: hypothetical protein IJ729_02070 [Alloprevotella sp.]|nr:hypothetical protein [Alloprevotella sp.]